MLQIWQDNKGHLTLDLVPAPMAPGRGVLVHNRYSLISAGTERSQVDLSRKSLLGKALARPELARQVWQKMKTEGVMSTLHKVNARLDEPVALGYSCAGVVEESTCEPYTKGDRVACAGIGFASHSEWVSVPQNLLAAVPDAVSDRAAATTTVGAIALHAVRQAEPQIGETVAVVGLGLVGQIAVMILAANGCRVIGFDPDSQRAAMALQQGAFLTCTTEAELTERLAGSFGADRVLVTAAAKNNGPIELAAAICRDRGRIVLVGDVGADLPRQPFYRKELELRYARSYGPGRYDSSYEELGHDYPQGYVRWTLQRNMAAYLELVALGRVKTDHLFTHTFAISDAERAYRIISGETSEPHLGILLQYPEQVQLQRKITLRSRPVRKATRVRLGMIGAGQFGTGVLLPALSKLGIARRTLCTRSGVKAKSAADRFGFSYATTDPQVVIRDPDIDWVVIATPHKLHAALTLDAMKAGKAVFVEKPLATSLEELSEIEAQYAHSPVPVMVGFNRRFAGLTYKLKSALSNHTQPLLMHYRVLAGRLPEDSIWHDAGTGGRIAGELCHFVDYCRFVAGSRILSVSAQAACKPGTSLHPPDHLQVHLAFANSSVATITYAAEADPGCGKEEFTVMGGGCTAILDNFRRLEIWNGGRATLCKNRGDKGHACQLEETVNQLKSGRPMPISFGELVNVTEATLRVLESLKHPGSTVQVMS